MFATDNAWAEPSPTSLFTARKTFQEIFYLGGLLWH